MKSGNPKGIILRLVETRTRPTTFTDDLDGLEFSTVFLFSTEGITSSNSGLQEKHCSSQYVDTLRHYRAPVFRECVQNFDHSHRAKNAIVAC